ncbi:MAG TPA: hypothetical protein VM536_12995, partial [Chloroflexia bacterium]|nr:hypothetical protein [Chloroflexia bacterium]
EEMTMKMELGKFVRMAIMGCAGMALVPMAAFAQAGPPPGQLVDQTPALTTARATYEKMTSDQVSAAGYRVVGDCVSSPFGAMGFHAMNFAVYQQQFTSGNMDPANPPILLIDGHQRVVGLEWETSKAAPQPTFLGQLVPLQPGHPGLEEDHYMVHVYFKPNNQMLLGVFDPDLTCPAGGASGPGMPSTGRGTADPLGLLLVLMTAWALLRAGRTLRARRA